MNPIRSIRSTALVLIVSWLVGAAPAFGQDAEPLDRMELIERAVGRLIEIQEPDGAWPYEGVYRVRREIPVGYRVGGTALVCSALLDAPIKDRTEADKAIRRGVTRILDELKHPLMKVSVDNQYDVRVWGHIYARLGAFCRAGAQFDHDIHGGGAMAFVGIGSCERDGPGPGANNSGVEKYRGAFPCGCSGPCSSRATTYGQGRVVIAQYTHRVDHRYRCVPALNQARVVNKRAPVGAVPCVHQRVASG